MHRLALAALVGALAGCGDGGGTGLPAGSGGSGGEPGTGGTAGQVTTGGAGTGTMTGSGGAGGETGASLCPSGSETLTLDLSGAAPVAVAGVPPADGYSPGFSILEGPVWIDGALLLSQISTNGQPPASRILKLTPGSEVQVFLDDAGTNGLSVDGAGQLFGAVHKDGSISRFDLSNPGTPPVVVAAGYLGTRFDSPNDLAIRSDGNIYLSDPDWQSPKPPPQSAERAYRVSPGGDVTIIGEYTENGSTQTVQKPNGVTLSRDESALFLGGAGGLFKLPVAADGSVGVGARVQAINGGVDGLGKDCAGNLYVATGQSVVVLDPGGAEIGTLPFDLQVTNVAFGGADRKTLYVTTLGGAPELFEVPLNVPGYPY